METLIADTPIPWNKQIMSSESDNPYVYHGAYGLCRDPSNRLLLVRVSNGLDAGTWTLPGGGIEWGEHPGAALLRELEEETGIVDIEKYRVAAVYSHVYKRSLARPYDSVQQIGIVYEVMLAAFDLRPEIDGSTDRCEWFTESEARQLPLGHLGEFAVDLAWSKTWESH